MHTYPIFVNLADKRCLVVGAGGVGKRKIQSLVDAGAGRIDVIDTMAPDEALSSLLDHENVNFINREFREDDLDDVFLAIVCTSNKTVNDHISKLCQRRGTLCNIADQPEAGSFIVPASVRRGDLTITVSTNGKSPAMARRVRRELQETFGDEYAHLLTVMGRVRPLMLALGLDTTENTAVFRALTESPLLEALRDKHLDSAGEILKQSLPQPLHDNIPELLDGLV